MRQWLFVQEFVRCGNASEATRNAGYSANGADVQGVRLLANARILQAVKHLQKKVEDRGIATLAEVIEMHRQTYEAAMADGDYSASNKAAELIGKSLGIYRDKIDLTGNIDWQAFAQLGLPNEAEPKNITPQMDSSN